MGFEKEPFALGGKKRYGVYESGTSKPVRITVRYSLTSKRQPL